VEERSLNVEVATESVSSLRNFALQLWPRMTETKWLSSDDAVVMLDYTLGRISPRKFRLFAVACCRCLAPLAITPNPPGSLIDSPEKLAIPIHKLIDSAEVLADNLVELPKVYSLRNSAERNFISAMVRYDEVRSNALRSIFHVAEEDASYAAYCLVRESPWWAVRPPLGASELADLLRHIAGNPFRDFPRSNAMPAAVCRLAEALYAGEDCSFALRDALLEAGQVELAEHFQETRHPKGCWAVDALLGKS
jgi:hypothetical protein